MLGFATVWGSRSRGCWSRSLRFTMRWSRMTVTMRRGCMAVAVTMTVTMVILVHAFMKHLSLFEGMLVTGHKTHKQRKEDENGRELHAWNGKRGEKQ